MSATDTTEIRWSFPPILPVPDEGLGNQAYLVELGDGRALALGPMLDMRSLDATAAANEPTVAFAADMHLHADLVSGATRPARRDGSQVISAAEGDRRFDHLGLAGLPDETVVFPTHGAGSFGSAPPGADRTSSIGREEATNPLIGLDDQDTLVEALLSSWAPTPRTSPPLPPVIVRARAIPARRRGPVDRPRGEGSARSGRRGRGAEVVDVPPTSDHTDGHVSGSLAIPLRGEFATRLGWLLPDPSTPIVVVRDPDQDPDEIIWQACKVGYFGTVGEPAGGVAVRAACDEALVVTPFADSASFDNATSGGVLEAIA